MDATTEETGPFALRDFSLEHYDTTQALAHAAEQAVRRKYEDFLIVDIDSHHYESEAFHEIVEYIDDPVLRHDAGHQGLAKPGMGVGTVPTRSSTAASSAIAAAATRTRRRSRTATSR
jgi:hypothetical protein